MGQKVSTPSRKRPPGAIMSGVALSKSTGGGASFAQQDLSEPEDEFLDVYLININQATLKQVEIGTGVKVYGFRVFTIQGLLGEIPHALRDKIEAGNYHTGVVLSVDKPKVRLVKNEHSKG